MKLRAPRDGKPWRKRAGVALVGLAALVLAIAGMVATGLPNRWAHGAIIRQLETATGGRVELERFRFHFLGLRAELDGLTVHGLEPAGTPPLFHADHLRLGFRVFSLFGSKISLDEVRLDHPAVHLRVNEDGRTNYPGPRTPPSKPAAAGKPGKPWRERIFDLAIRELHIEDGNLLFNHVQVPLQAEGRDFHFALYWRVAATGKEYYEGDLRWKQMTLAARRYLPFASDLAAKFTLARDTFELREFRWKLPESELLLSAELSSFAHPAWAFRYQGRLSLDDVRRILRKPRSPRGRVEFLGEGSYKEKKVALRGSYVARQIEMPYPWFHASGIESHGTYRVQDDRLELTDFEARALGGVLQGRMDLEFEGLKFRVDSRARGINLAALLAAVDRPNFPVQTLHWNGSVEVEAVTSWTGEFRHFESHGRSLWSPPAEPRQGEIPVSAQFDYQYVGDEKAVRLSSGQISTPSSRIEMEGRLGARDSALAVQLDVRDLVPWNDFINRLSGQTRPGVQAEGKRIAGRAEWHGRVLGPLEGPTFTGHVKGFKATYDRLYWDELEGDLIYSPQQLRLQRARARHGRSAAELDLWLELRDWGFTPESQWTLTADFAQTPTDGLQELLGTSYPAHGLLTGQLRGQGTRSAPECTGVVDVTEAQAWGFRWDRARGQLSARRDEIRVAGAEIRKGQGRISGNFAYRPPQQEIAFEAAGAGLSLEDLERLQTPRLPLGGQLSFEIRGSGPLHAPISEGTARLENLRISGDLLGSFEGRLRSDGQRVQLDLDSTMTTGSLNGKLELALAGDYPLEGDVTMQGMDLDPFIESGFHLKALTGHSRVDGRFLIAGPLAHPENLTVQAELSRLSLDYEHLKLENEGPVRFLYRRAEARIQQAHLRGPQTDLAMSGTAGFSAEHPLDLAVAGTINLQLLRGFVPRLHALGAAQVNVSFQGMYDDPRITGKVRVENAAANYSEFPAGLSQIAGEFVFDRSRMVYQDVKAEIGGGEVVLSGTLVYGEGALRYDLSARASRVRVRYPEGMSWLAGGTLRLSGTPQAALLSGRVVVERLVMSEGSDLAALLAASHAGLKAPATTSEYLRNLQFDIEATSSPGARVEWTSARFHSEASLRVRGTWEHPILLGDIRLLSGEMVFRGNRYRLTRGDINFTNPFRLDPVLNVEATTTIRQYEVTLDFTGPSSHLSLAYRSDPPLPSTDVITLLALGRTSEESESRSPTRVQSPELGATTLLSQAVSSQIGSRVERLFGISRFRVDPFLAGTGTEQNAAARVTIEQQVARDLTITYVSNVTSTQQQVIQVEYTVRRDLSLILLRDQNGTFGVDVKFKKRFR